MSVEKDFKYYTEGSKPTLLPAPSFDAIADASALYKAMKGLGTDEDAIIRILAKRSSEQRQKIKMEFESKYGKDLENTLKKDLTGNFEEVILALMTPHYEYLARELHDAMKGMGTNERTIVEILCTRDNASIIKIKIAYRILYDEDLKDDIKDETSGDFKDFLKMVLEADRQEDDKDFSVAPSLAIKLYEAGEKAEDHPDSEEFDKILTTYSLPVLKEVFREYEKISGKSFGEAVDATFSGCLKNGYKAIYQSVENRAKFFAQELNSSMAGAGTNDKSLIRLIVSRCEIDLGNIKEAFLALTGMTLGRAIKDDTNGDYRNVLIVLQD